MSRSFATPWTVAHQAPLSMGFLRQECWSGLLFPFPGDLPNPLIEPVSPELASRFAMLNHQGNPIMISRTGNVALFEWQCYKSIYIEICYLFQRIRAVLPNHIVFWNYKQGFVHSWITTKKYFSFYLYTCCILVYLLHYFVLKLHNIFIDM